MNRVAILSVVVTALCTAGVCYVAFTPSEQTPTVDGSSETTFRASMDAVKQSLPRDRHEEFEQAMESHAHAVLVPTGSGDNALALLLALSADKDAPSRRLRSRLDGLTAQQIVRTAASLPDMTAARRNANESAAIATLKNIFSSQSQCQASGIIDANKNGAGEYGFFAELAGATPVRNDELGGVSTATITPPVLSRAFGNVQASRVIRSGYIFQMYLPSSTYAATAEAPTGGGSGVSIDANKAEVMWCCYAWPSDYPSSGNRVFFVNQAGDVLASRNSVTKYNGGTKAPRPLAALLGTENDMAGMYAANTTGRDGELWLIVN